MGENKKRDGVKGVGAYEMSMSMSMSMRRRRGLSQSNC
jgi:hypothetical protein